MMIAGVAMTTLLLISIVWVVDRYIIKRKNDEETFVEKPKISLEPTKDECHGYLLPINNANQIVYQHANWAMEREGLPPDFREGQHASGEELRFLVAALRRQCRKLLKEKYSE